jgi:hypothetical protein
MKRLFAHVTQSRYRVYLVFSLVLLTFLSVPLYAQGPPPLSDGELYKKAHDAYEAAKKTDGMRQWIEAARYLTAYVERNPDWMKERKHRDKVEAALEHCIARIAHSGNVETLCEDKCPTLYAGVRFKMNADQPPPPLDPVPAQTDTSAPRSYPLVCRGGGDLVFSYAASSSFSNKPHIRITFEKATVGVGSNAEHIASLGAGQCAFIDRGIRSNEPSSIVIGYPVLQPDEFSISWTRQGTVTSLDRGLDYLHNLEVGTANYESFQVYNDRKGNFVVTKRGFVIGFLEVASGRDYQIAHEGLTSGLAAGARVYTDRDFTYTSVPRFLEGATYILTANDDKLGRGDDEFLSFQTNRATTVYVAHDDRYATKPAWLNSFRKRSEDVVFKAGTSNITLSLFERTFPGGRITLGSNVVPAETENNGMYTVIIKKSE